MPFSGSGKTTLLNDQAQCTCRNFIKGSMIMELRPWQAQALQKCLKWLVERGEDRHFLINAAPGSGKTIAACVIAKDLIDTGYIDRVIVIAPRNEVVRQWGQDF